MQSTNNPGFWRVADGSAVIPDQAYAAWADAAYPVLIAIAREYHALITYGELATKVKAVSGIDTKQTMYFWIGKVLKRVVLEAHRRDDPALTALVVSTEGYVGDGYRLVLESAGRPAIEDVVKREEHAADERLRCYQKYCPSMPTDGGVAKLAPKLEAKLRSRAQVVEAPAPVCPKCFLELTVSGVCGSCD